MKRLDTFQEVYVALCDSLDGIKAAQAAIHPASGSPRVTVPDAVWEALCDARAALDVASNAMEKPATPPKREGT
jgi:hypothetical protein